MSSSIPYNHPSLVIGNIVDTRVLGLLKSIDGCQSKIDAAQDKLNSLILMKRSISMTLNELADMDIDVTILNQKQESLNSSISSAASDYLAARIENETQIQQLRAQLSDLEIQENMESPIDFSVSALKPMPLSAESIKLDSQYFSFGSNMQDDTLANVEKFIRSSTSNLGDKSEEITSAVSSQINNQIQNHSIAGTLIITASCTHSNVKIFEPLIIDPDKAVSAWNTINGKQSRINTLTLKNAEQEVRNEEEEDENALTLITGATYGSSFVGMVHILNADSSMSGNIDQLKSILDDKLKIGGWINNASGGFGIDDAVLKEVQGLLSTQSFSSHVSAVVMGALPSMSSSKLSSGIKKLGELEINAAALLGSDSGEGIETVNSDAEKAREGARIISAQNMKLKAMMKSLGEMDKLANSMLDVNSLMSSFDNYLTAISNKETKTGVPISFYLKKLTKSSIEKMWLNKYYPKQEADKES